MSYFAFESHCTPDVAWRMLAGLLRSGRLALFLGAGVSVGYGLPNWSDLVGNCEESLGWARGVDSDESSLLRRARALRSAVADDSAFMQLVRDGLYSAASTGGAYSDDVLTQKMLIAIGAIVMSSVRGSVSDVITLNFDDLLEWYLHLHGFRTQVVTEPATLLSGAVDVRVHHFHGSVPLTQVGTTSRSIVFTEDEFQGRLDADANSPWPVLLAGQLMTKTVLFVGTSMSDRDVGKVLDSAAPYLSGSRPVAYVLLVNPATDLVNRLKVLGAVPVELPNHDAIPEFLLQVCRGAAVER